MAGKLDLYYKSALSVTKIAGKLIKTQIHNLSMKVDRKTCDIDLVTETDKAVEDLIIKTLSEEFPDHKFIGEESVAGGQKVELTSEPTWIIDPIDGTLNFVHTFPHSCISLGLFIDKKPALGIIYNPILEQLFTAQKGGGAFYNGDKIQVSGQTDLNKALIMYELGTTRDPKKRENVKTNIGKLIEIVHGMRSTGSAALNMAMVALGGADAYFEFGTHIWDIAAGEIIVTEAGGVIMDPSGGPIDRLSRRVLIASSESLAKQLSEKLVQFYPTPFD